MQVIKLILTALPVIAAAGLLILSGLHLREHKKSQAVWVARYYFAVAVAQIEAAILILLLTYLILKP